MLSKDILFCNVLYPVLQQVHASSLSGKIALSTGTELDFKKMEFQICAELCESFVTLNTFSL